MLITYLWEGCAFREAYNIILWDSQNFVDFLWRWYMGIHTMVSVGFGWCHLLASVWLALGLVVVYLEPLVCARFLIWLKSSCKNWLSLVYFFYFWSLRLRLSLNKVHVCHPTLLLIVPHTLLYTDNFLANSLPHTNLYHTLKIQLPTQLHILRRTYTHMHTHTHTHRHIPYSHSSTHSRPVRRLFQREFHLWYFSPPIPLV